MRDEHVSKRHTYFRETTAQQRRLLFETYERTGSVQEACQAARVSRGTFYHWRPRFAAGGYPALEQPGRHTPHHEPNQVPEAVAAQVIALKQAQPTWGRVRIAQELAKANHWVPLLSPSSVRRVLRRAGMLPEPTRREKKGGPAPGTPTTPAKR
jgi:transposase